MRCRAVLSVLGLALGATVALGAPGARAAVDPTGAPELLQGASHNAVASAAFSGPLHLAWTRTLPGSPSYAVTDAGRVFSVADGWAYALRAADGAVLWAVDIGGDRADLVASDGILLVSGREDGSLLALDEATGLRRWGVRTTPGLYTFRFGPALAPGTGVVYVATEQPSGVQARRLADGALVWQQPSAGTPVAADASTIYTDTITCGTAAFSLVDGTERWERAGSCGTRPTGPVDGAGMVAGSTLYDPSGQILWSSTGKPVADYTSDHTPVRAGGVLLLERAGTLAAMPVDAPSGTPVWTFTGDPGSAPDVLGQVVVAGRQVFVRTSARSLYTLDIASGRPTGAPLTLPSAPADPRSGAQDVPAMGDGLLIVPNGPNLTALAATPYAGPVPTPPTPIAVHPSAPAAATDATSYLQNGARDGVNGSAALPGPLAQAWGVRFHGTVSYPLLLAGRVYVTVQTGSTEDLYALDQRNGRLLWRVGLPFSYGYGAQAVYDRGYVYVITATGQLVRVRATDGKVLYREQVPTGGLPGGGWSTPPSAYGGVLYLVGDGAGSALYAIRESDGALLRGQRSDSGHGALGLYQGLIYQDSACSAEALRLTTGAPVWASTTGCDGTGFSAATVHSHTLYDVDDAAPSRRLDAATGALLGTFSASTEPTFAGSLMITLNHGTLSGEDPATGRLVWQQSRGYVLPPAAVGDTVLDVDAAGRTYAIDGLTGAITFLSAPGAPPAHEVNSSLAMTGIATAAGIVAVPEGNLLVAFRSR